MFYDTFVHLCEQKGIKPTRAAIESGIARSAVSNWKSNWENGVEVLPSNATAKVLAVYFGVSVDYLLGSEKGATPSTSEISDVLNEVDVAFYGEYKELTDDEKDVVRDMVRVMRERRKNKQQGR